MTVPLHTTRAGVSWWLEHGMLVDPRHGGDIRHRPGVDHTALPAQIADDLSEVGNAEQDHRLEARHRLSAQQMFARCKYAAVADRRHA